MHASCDLVKSKIREQIKNKESIECFLCLLLMRMISSETITSSVNLPSLRCAILRYFSLFCVCLLFLVLWSCHQGTWISKCIYLACGCWCKRVVITSVSTRSCYITVIICDVMVCVWVCVKSSLLWVLGPQPSESPKTIKVKSDSLHFRPLHHETPSHIPLMLYTAEVLVAMVITSLNSVPLHSTPFDETLPIPACLCTDVL